LTHLARAVATEAKIKLERKLFDGENSVFDRRITRNCLPEECPQMNLITGSMLFYYFGKYLQMKNHKKLGKKFQIKTSKNDFCCNLFDFNLLSLQTYQIQGTA